MDFLNELKELLPDEWKKPLSISSIVFLTLSYLYSRFRDSAPVYLRYAILLLGIDIIAASVHYYIFHVPLNALIPETLVAALTLFVPIELHHHYEDKLNNIKTRKDPIERLSILRQLSEENLSPNQKREYTSCLAECYFPLGSLEGCLSLLKRTSVEPNLLYLQIQCNALFLQERWNEILSQSTITQELETVSCSKHHEIIAEIYHKIGFAAQSLTQFDLADNYYARSLNKLKENKSSNRLQTAIAYFELIMHRMRPALSIAQPSWNVLFDEFKNWHNRMNLDESAIFFDIQICILRQKDEPRIQQLCLIEEGYEHLLSLCSEDIEKSRLSIRTLRQIHMLGGNPLLCLKMIEESIGAVEEYSFKERWYFFKELAFCFQDLKLHPNIDFPFLRKKTKEYMTQKASKDLALWHDSLNAYTIVSHYEYLLEKACYYSKYSPKEYSFERIKSILLEASDFCKYHNLPAKSLLCRLNLIDEALALKNMKKYRNYLASKYENEINQQMDVIHSEWKTITTEAEIEEFSVRMGFYSILTRKYEDASFYYEQSQKNWISIKHFSNWMNKYHLLLHLICRLLWFSKAYQHYKENISNMPTLPIYERQRQICDEIVSGSLESYLIAACFADIPIPHYIYRAHHFCCYPLDGKYMKTHPHPSMIPLAKPMVAIHSHQWNYFPSLNIIVDLTLPHFLRKKETVFIEGTHPFIDKKSKWNQSLCLSEDPNCRTEIFRIEAEKIFLDDEIKEIYRDITDSFPKFTMRDEYAQKALKELSQMSRIHSDILDKF